MPENDQIVRCAIHPAIGIARVGNAPADEYYLAPEVPGRAADPGPPGYKNEKGQIRREAARFRIYGYNAKGEVVKEITVDDAEITWEVHVANRKAAWYKFLNALDLKQFVMIPDHRNATIPSDRRRDLVIDPGPRTISGVSQSGPQYAFDQGWISFEEGSPIEVPLGEIRTDDKGRLIVIGGEGRSASYNGAQAVTFANNDGWYDDTSDGPVRAQVKLAGSEVPLDAEPAMVAVTPPNYGQGLYGPVTMYDVVYDLYLRQGWIEKPGTITFWEHIFPIFERLVGNQWVSQGVYFLFGAGSPSDLTDEEYLKKLADPDPQFRPVREALFRWFRLPPPPWDTPGPRADLPPAEPAGLPPFYGDGVDYTGLTIYDLAVTTTQYEWLRLWAEGKFETGSRPERLGSLEKVPVEKQPAVLDRTPLEDCLGGPFHPGIELTWPLRVPILWQEPGNGLLYRVKVLPPGEEPADDYGPFLTPGKALGPGGPLDGSGPGSLTRWMGIPWQTDEASCLSGYNTSNYLPLPSFWAARVPNQVLAMQSYERLEDASLPEHQKMKHFTYRQFWLRDLNASGAYQARINNMVKNWDAIGIIAGQEAPAGATGPGWPERFWVETGRAEKFVEPDPTFEQVKRAERPAEFEEDREALFKVTAEALPARTDAERAAHPRPQRHVVRRDR
ncbi:MAG TPA: LodA/GoxA family CTQ-dependent oxidase [Thermoanaerobaculia bacterium]|nr:LodA/GoxA family CTQ-dependent oxidase [Thermoanaerobaculia bacterium]